MEKKINRPPEPPTDYNKLMTDFLASDKSEEYKKSILTLLNTDYSKCTYGVKERYNATLGSRLNEIRYETFNSMELGELAKNLRVKNYMKVRKQELIKEINDIKKQFCNKD